MDDFLHRHHLSLGSTESTSILGGALKSPPSSLPMSRARRRRVRYRPSRGSPPSASLILADNCTLDLHMRTADRNAAFGRTFELAQERADNSCCSRRRSGSDLGRLASLHCPVYACAVHYMQCMYIRPSLARSPLAKVGGEQSPIVVSSFHFLSILID